MGELAKNPVKATERTFTIIEALEQLDGARLCDLSDYLELPKSTVHNHLQTLLEHGYVRRADDEYRIGFKFLHYGEYARSNERLYRVARPVIDDLAEETGEVANLMVPAQNRGIYLYKTKGTKAVNHDTRSGKYIDLHCTALGKAILAHLPQAQVEEIIDDHGLDAKTSRTVATREELYDELAQIREQGFAQNRGERIERVRCVAAPITNRENIAIGSISVSSPETRMKGERFDEILPELLCEAANVVEINLLHEQ
ncbi:IclR family transcriptional regulator [Halorussus halophilus]|uniref:IclR family transcriptional regulator n=1 Tax=Halorussus halophilus TaxID=2650975 RepID=UPI00130100D4|nr:IclR family transcriptional regulator [Halorussus halophilus]